MRMGLGMVGTGILLSGCSESSPEDAVTVYIEHWEQREYSEMYSMLTDTTKEEIAEDEFVDLYESIYDAYISDFTVRASFPDEDSDDHVELIQIEVGMETVAGPHSFNEEMVVAKNDEDEDTNWKIEWSPQQIFPELQPGDTVEFNTFQPERGEIFSSDGQGLAINGVVLNVAIVPGRMTDEEREVEQIAEGLDVSEDMIQNRLEQGWVTDESFVPITQLPEAELSFIEELMEEIPGLTYRLDPGRVYPFGSSAAHLTGYVKQITAEQLENREGLGYDSQSILGQTGLESAQEERLRGYIGAELITRGADGSRKATLAETEAEDGDDLYLTVDMDIQEEIVRQLDNQPGTAVALHPKTGETLALVSSPSYDPNLMALGLTSSQSEELDENEDEPMLNRFYYSFSPGSTMKPLTAAFGLEQGTLVPEDTIEVSGKEWQPDDSDWGDYSVRRVTDPGGPVDLTDALVYSDNIYFANVALELGEDSMQEWAESFGFYETIDYLYPFKQSTLTEEGGFSSDIQLADSGYGQGQVQVNPLHLAAMYTPFLNEGAIIQPILDQDEETGVTWKEPISAETAMWIDQALEQVVSSPSGTAHSMQLDDYSLAAKTGTAELSGAQGESGDDVLGWVVSYNRDDPDLLIAMMQEGVRSGELLDKVKKIYEFAR